MERLKCCVCGSAKNVSVCASSFGSMSDAFCETCLSLGKENYRQMVAYLSMVGTTMDCFNEDYQLFINHQLMLHGKTVSEFEADLLEADIAMDY